MRIIQGDCLDILPTLEAESVQCCCTSPPYWGLRSYLPNGHDDKSLELGSEPTPELYVANMVRVFREVWRVLKDDGTLWLNIGDSYASGEVGRHDSVQGREIDGKRVTSKATHRQQTKLNTGLKPKDLCGIPWRLAFALQADGWYLRQDIIWSKGSPMPESVTDRCTRSHEYIFLLAKRAKYYYNADAIKEKAVTEPGIPRENPYSQMMQTGGKLTQRLGPACENGLRNRRSVWHVNSTPYAEAHFATFPPDLIKPCILAGSRLGDTVLDPFAGSGTTLMVATELGRKSIGIELNPAYVEMINDRTNVTVGML